LNGETDTFRAGYSASYTIDARWSVHHSAHVTVLDDEIDASPLTVDDEPVAASLAVLYRIL